MLASAPQFFLEFSFLLLVFYLCIKNLQLLPSEKASLLAGIPLVALLLPGLRIPYAVEAPAMIGWVAGSFSWWEADWGLFIRHASLADLLLIAYWLGFAVFFARFLDKLAKLGLAVSGFSFNRFFRRAFDPAQTHYRALAALMILGKPEDSKLKEQARFLFPGYLYRGYFFEVLIIEFMVMINWWNPIIHFYRKSYLQQTRLELESQLFPYKINFIPGKGEVNSALKRIILTTLSFLFIINMQTVIPGSAAYVQFLQDLETKSQTAFFGDLTVLEPSATLEWGGHEIPLAAVHTEADLSYEVYYVQPFEFHMLRSYKMRLRVGLTP